MPQSLSKAILHLVFSTKERRPLIPAERLAELHAYIATVARENECPVLIVGGTTGHVHIACILARTQTIAFLVERLKTHSSKWLKTKLPDNAVFAWQNGYGTFSVGESQTKALREYIANQSKHHERRSFADEFRMLLRRYQVLFDERYVWD